MDFLNQATAQVRDLVLSMTPAARITALLLVGVIGVSLGYLVKQQSASPDEYLFGGEYLPFRDANRVDAAIAQAGLNGSEREGNRFKVPRGQKAAYLAAVADAGALPPNFHELMDKALDIGPFADRVTRQQKIKAAKEQKLSMMISAMSDIEDATVIFDIQDQRGFSKKSTATATVSIVPAIGEAPNARRMKIIRQTVAGAIIELKPENVIVTNLSTNSIYGGGDEISSASFDDPYYQTRVTYEALMKSKIENQLQSIPGATVQVTAELDNRLELTSQSTVPEGEPTALRETTDENSTIISQDENGGRPGLTAQANTRTNEQTTQSVVKNETTSSENQTDNFVGTKNEFERLAGMTPLNVRAAIGIPKSYLISVWRERERLKGNDVTQPLPGDINTRLETLEEGIRAKVQNLVLPLLPRKLAQENLTNVLVTFVDSITPDPIEPPSQASEALSWAGQNFNTITMTFVAMISLVMLRSMVKAIPPSEPSPAISAATLGIAANTTNDDDSEVAETSDIDDTGRPKLRLKKGPRLTDDLTEIVREDPDAAAAILRSWIGNAG